MEYLWGRRWVMHEHGLVGDVVGVDPVLCGAGQCVEVKSMAVHVHSQNAVH